jgi:hypothetical protein
LAFFFLKNLYNGSWKVVQAVAASNLGGGCLQRRESIPGCDLPDLENSYCREEGKL